MLEGLPVFQLQKRTVHTVYVLEPRKKDVCKQLLKLLAPAQEASFKVTAPNCLYCLAFSELLMASVNLCRESS